jgi:hypothetical protein
MKKKFVMTLVSVAVIALFALFMAITKAPEIQADTAELRINNNDGSAEEVVVDIVDAAFISTINSIISKKIYYKQPYINSYSRDEIDYEIKILEKNESGVIVAWYNILLNDNENESTNLSNKSRLDVMTVDAGIFNWYKNCSLKLSKEQETMLLEAVMKYRQ